MMIKYKVSDVAKDFGKQSKEIIAILAEYFDEPKKSSSVLEENELNVVFDYLSEKNSVENFDEFFAVGEQAREARKAEKQAEKEKILAQQQAILEALKAQQKAEKQAKEPKTETNTEKADTKGADKKATENAKKPAENVQKPIENKPKPVQTEKPFDAKPKKEAGIAPNRGPQETRKVDTRISNINVDKYNEKYYNIADAASKGRINDNAQQGKQKIKQKRKDYRRPQGAKRETEADRLRRIQLEKIKATPVTVTVGESIAVGDLAAGLKKTAAEVIKCLMKLGMMATVNQSIDYDTAEIVVNELGCKIKKQVVVTIEEQIMDMNEDKEEDLKSRCPVVCVMGHVDHGKTSILDAIRKTSVTSGEAGGITQAIGAYQVNFKGNDITFLDTPGHAAFTAMRQRGANSTDIAVLVVAADDGIMPQTIEAINHAKAAKVQVIVAINKMDKPEANPDRIKQQLTEHELVPEEWGGDVICVPVSAKTGEGLDKLLENILLVAEMMELKANPDRAAKGVVIEARMDKGRGPVATLLVQTGTLHSGDIVVAGFSVGHVRVMSDENGKPVKVAGPSVPVEITGLAEVPAAGDGFDAVSDERLARELVEQRKEKAKEEEFNSTQKVTLDNLFSQLEEGELKDLNVIVKADVQGSVEAVRDSLVKLSNEEVRVNVIHGAVGAINESDVMLAATSGAIIVGFNVRPDAIARETAERDGVDMRMYRVIYDCIEEIESAMKGMLAPKFREVALGQIEVREVYKITGAGIIAGCYVTNGKVVRGASIRVVRDGIVLAEDQMASLRRFKDDVKEVAQGYECGIGLEKFVDIKVGDVYEAFTMEEYTD